MNNFEFVEILKHIASLPTAYNNRYPRNLGYYDGKKWSFDCWNLIKTVINRVGLTGGWYDSKVGEYQKNLSITGDCSGLALLNKCTVKSKDFKSISIPGTYLFIRNTHSGIYIGNVTIGGKQYNVIECTAAWTKNVLYSWVDADGTRRRYKGGPACSKWTDWGLLPYITYVADLPIPTPATTPTPTPVPAPTPAPVPKGKFVKNGIDYSYVFDPVFYYNLYGDLRNHLKNKYNEKWLFQHFLEFGMHELRVASPYFNIQTYAGNNADVCEKIGFINANNAHEYYEHYCKHGHSDTPRRVC